MDTHIRGSFWSKFVIVLFIALMVAGGATAQFTHYLQQITKVVTLYDDGYHVEITTYDETVADLMERYDITLGPGDTMQPGPETLLEKETTIVINRAMAAYAAADGREETVYLIRGTVADVLKDAGIEVREQDIVNYPLSRQVTPEMRISVTRMDEHIYVESEGLPYQIVTRKSSRIDEGVDRILQEGRQGELERKILVVYRDGVEVAREIKSETVVAEPVDHIVQKGTGKHFTNSRGLVVRYSAQRKMVATAYTAGYESTGKTPDHPKYGRTASGRMVKPHHTIAAPPNIPFGTKVYIPELVTFWRKRGVEISGIFTVEDRGGGIQGNQLDIYIESKGIARIWGRRSVNVYFLR